MNRLSSMTCFAVILIVGCAGSSRENRIVQYLDGGSGVTVTSLAAPLVFFKDAPMLAANARDYLYVGPAELNRSGKHEVVLWMYFCSTIDRNGAEDPGLPEHVILMLENTPMELIATGNRVNIRNWSYSSPVAGGQTVVYSLTRNQLRLLAKTGDTKILAAYADGSSKTFQAWGPEDPGFRQFTRYLEDESPYFLTVANEPG